MRVTLHRLPDGRLSFYALASSEEITGELSEGYRLDEGAYDGQLKVFGKPSELGMSADDAVDAGVLKLLAP